MIITNVKEENNNSLKTQIKVSKKYKEVYDILQDQPLNTNEICKKLNLTVNEVNSKLLFMEMEGLVKRVAGNSYIKI